MGAARGRARSNPGRRTRPPQSRVRSRGCSVRGVRRHGTVNSRPNLSCTLMPTLARTLPSSSRATRRGPLNGASQLGRSSVWRSCHSPVSGIVSSTRFVVRNTQTPKLASPTPRISPSSSPTPGRSRPPASASVTASTNCGGTLMTRCAAANALQETNRAVPGRLQASRVADNGDALSRRRPFADPRHEVSLESVAGVDHRGTLPTATGMGVGMGMVGP